MLVVVEGWAIAEAIDVAQTKKIIEICILYVDQR